jgi:hypothetical protein
MSDRIAGFIPHFALVLTLAFASAAHAAPPPPPPEYLYKAANVLTAPTGADAATLAPLLAGDVAVSENGKTVATGKDASIALLTPLLGFKTRRVIAHSMGDRDLLITDTYDRDDWTIPDSRMVARALPLPGQHILVIAENVSLQRQDQGEGVLRHGALGVAADVGDGDAVLAAVFLVDHVGAGGRHRDQLELGEMLQGLAHQRDLVVDDDGGVFRPLHDLADIGPVMHRHRVRKGRRGQANLRRNGAAIQKDNMLHLNPRQNSDYAPGNNEQLDPADFRPSQKESLVQGRDVIQMCGDAHGIGAQRLEGAGE